MPDLSTPEFYIGIMSGTSLDGIDVTAVEFAGNSAPRLLHHHYLRYDENLRAELLALNSPGENELERAALAGNALSRCYAEAIHAALNQATLNPHQIIAIGCHGQTVRHRPDLGFTTQLVNPALLAELAGISVVADFRSRDIAAGGQGAPLVPAFHAAAFRHPNVHRTIVNIGGIANLTDLPPQGKVVGFDCGPGNLLLDGWATLHQGTRYDEDGEWAQKGDVIPELLAKLLAEPFFVAQPPKSTGRDLFNLPWLRQFLLASYQPADIQATLLDLTVYGIAGAIDTYCPGSKELYLCGGGAHNGALVRRLKLMLPAITIEKTDVLGIPADQVEAFAFAWLARQTIKGNPGNLPEVTGARGLRVLGAVYPA
jgi:anhydro-N-acetylmuramic acid kinase